MQYKIVACILLILSVFSVVLAAPVPAQEVRGACADAVERGENVIIVSEKRALGGSPNKGAESDYPHDLSDTESDLFSIDLEPPSSSGTKSVSWAPTTKVHFYDEEPLPFPPPSPKASTPGGAPLDTEGASKPGITTENQPPSSSGTKSASWGPTTKFYFYDEKPLGPLPPKPQPKGVVSNLKTYFGELGKLNFRPRFQRTVDTGA
jgi:hypothetical protein